MKKKYLLAISILMMALSPASSFGYGSEVTGGNTSDDQSRLPAFVKKQFATCKTTFKDNGKKIFCNLPPGKTMDEGTTCGCSYGKTNPRRTIIGKIGEADEIKVAANGAVWLDSGMGPVNILLNKCEGQLDYSRSIYNTKDMMYCHGPQAHLCFGSESACLGSKGK